MSHFYCSIDSDTRKSPATSRGRRDIECHLRSWDCGIRVVGRIDKHGTTRFFVQRTGGSNDPSTKELLVAL